MRRRHLRESHLHVLQHGEPAPRPPEHKVSEAAAVHAYAGGAESAALLAHPSASSHLRRSLAQSLGHAHGNQFLSRMIAADIQRSADPTVQQGSRGAAVQQLQQMLNQGGASLAVDGIFGAQTRQAVIAYQRSAGLTPDGIVGPKTWAQLRGGNVNAAQGAGASSASPLIMAKLTEINAMMQKIGTKSASRSPQTAPQTETIRGSTEPVEMVTNHVHDSSEDDSWWGSATNAASEAWDSAGEAASGVYNSVSETASDAWNTVSEGASEAWDTVSETAGSAWNSVSETASEAWDHAKTIAGGMVENVSSGVQEIVQTAQHVVNGGIDDVVQGVSDIANDVGSAISEFSDDLKERFADEIAAVEEVVNDIAEFLSDPEGALRKLEEILNGLKKKAGELLGDEDEIPDTIVGTAEGSVGFTDPTVCHDSPVPTKKLRFSLNMDTRQPSEIPAGSTLNHDSVRGTLNLNQFDTRGDAKLATVPKSDFGTTGARISIGKIAFEAKHFTDYVTASAPFTHEVSYDVTDFPGRQDVPPGLDNITSDNWKEAANDLDPDVHKTELGAPKRAKYWARDITESHEKFHVADNLKYVKDTVFPETEAALNKKEIDVPIWVFRDTEIAQQLHQIGTELTKEAVKSLNQYMAPPAVEQRAYSADETSYRSRVKAIRDKAKKEGWDVEKDKKKP